MPRDLTQTTGHAKVSRYLVDRLGTLCLGLPEAYEEQAWTGTRWRDGWKPLLANSDTLPIDRGWCATTHFTS